MSTRSKVFIVNTNHEYNAMFLKRGWELSSTIKGANLVQFTGGEDVCPALYGEQRHPDTFFNLERDKKEELIFDLALKAELPMAGICRGGQFLNVMCGGSLWQDVDSHAINGTHTAWDTITGDTFQVTSTHHQMMRPGDGGFIIAHAGRRAKMKDRMRGTIMASAPSTEDDVEAVFYKEQKVFCFQPHPEFAEYNKLADRYFEYLFELLEVL